MNNWIEHFDVYTAEQVIYGERNDTGWVSTPKPHTLGKIPVIYYTQDTVEWYDVVNLYQSLQQDKKFVKERLLGLVTALT